MLAAVLTMRRNVLFRKRTALPQIRTVECESCCTAKAISYTKPLEALRGGELGKEMTGSCMRALSQARARGLPAASEGMAAYKHAHNITSLEVLIAVNVIYVGFLLALALLHNATCQQQMCLCITSSLHIARVGHVV